MDTTLLLQIAAGLGLFLLGLAAGLVLRRRDAGARARAAALESQLAETQQELEGYRARVEKHFEHTSHLFRDLTDQYSSLYNHLAEGARTLCPDGGPALGLGLNDPLLEGGDLLSDEASERASGAASERVSEAAPDEAAPEAAPEAPAAERASERPDDAPDPGVRLESERPRESERPLDWEDLVADGDERRER